ACDDLTRVDADAGLDTEPWQRVPHFDRRTAGTQGVVLVCSRHSEHGHHRVADELLDTSAVSLDDLAHALEVAREQPAHDLWIARPSERSRAGDVAKENGHDLPLFMRGVRERRPAERAIDELAGDFPAARRTDHTANLRRATAQHKLLGICPVPPRQETGQDRGCAPTLCLE